MNENELKSNQTKTEAGTEKVTTTNSDGTTSTKAVNGVGKTRDTISGTETATDSLATTVQSGKSIYHVSHDMSGTEMKTRSLTTSRLWHGVPQLTTEQMKYFEAAYTGHTFFFVTGLPKFMTTGAYKEGTNMYQMAQNIKAIIEKCTMSFSGPSAITANSSDQDDGAGRKISHVSSVIKEQNDITLRLHEFAGLPLKNGLETWLTGISDYRSQRGNYFGNLNISGGWCLANHTMSLLVVQTDPSWTEIQDAAWYCNMFPTEVPFDSFNFEKGTSEIVPDADITFKCNEVRSDQVMEAAVAYMNHKILNMVNTAVYVNHKAKPFSESEIPSIDDGTYFGTNGDITE